MKKQNNLLLTMSLASAAAYAELPAGLIGGSTSGSEAYSAHVSSSNSVVPISGLSFSGQINGVDLNQLGLGLIGGQDPTGGYAAFVSSDGTLNVLSLGLSSGTVSSASINNNGSGLIGGNDGSFNMYAAFVSENQTVTPLPLTLPGFIHSTAINDSGMALIGGEGNSFPYAAYVTPANAVTQIDTTPLVGGHLAVAINESDNGIIGGYSTLGAYAAFVSPASTLPSPLSPIPSGGSSYISGVAINDSGIGLIGGNDDTSNIYAGYVSATGVVTPLFTTLVPGQIVSVALNQSGTGLIGGNENSNLYAAFVLPDKTLNALLLGSLSGSINSVAINDAGVGLIGGQAGSDAYAALIAPNGAVTLLDVNGQSNISSVAILNPLEAATPPSVGPYFSGFYTQLAASSALEARLVRQNRMGSQRGLQSNPPSDEVVYNEAVLLAQNPTIAPWASEKIAQQKPNSVWLIPFGNYVHLKAQGSIPSYSNEIGGFLLGYDRVGCNTLVGASAGYAFNYIGYSQGIGHSKMQEEMISLYGSYYLDRFWFNAALWGGLYQLSNVRHTLSTITSTASTHGWILSPHFEMAFSSAIDACEKYFIELFLMADWVNSWQHKYTESGAAGLNLQMGSLYGSLLQSEAGFRFYQQFDYCWGQFFLEEKMSYINQAPFNLNTTTTSFIGASSTFPITVGSSHGQNLGSAQLIGSFVPQNRAYPYGGFALQITANEMYQSYFASVFSGMDF